MPQGRFAASASAKFSRTAAKGLASSPSSRLRHIVADQKLEALANWGAAGQL